MCPFSIERETDHYHLRTTFWSQIRHLKESFVMNQSRKNISDEQLLNALLHGTEKLYIQ